MKFLRKLVILLIVVLVAAGAWAWSGIYNIGADAPHWKVTEQVLAFVRERSIEHHAESIVSIPDLGNPALVKLGAEHYHEMCTGCHLAPGMTSSEMREGLYPKPPNLTRFAPDPAEAFWVIKHGIKMSAMPAWGKTHDDHKIWAMVAFLQQLPHMSVARYQSLVNAPAQAPSPAATSSAPAAAASTAPAPAPASSR